MILQHSASEYLAYGSLYLAQWDIFDKMELGMEKLHTQALIVTLGKVQPYQISLKSRVILESPRARMFSQ